MCIGVRLMSKHSQMFHDLNGDTLKHQCHSENFGVDSECGMCNLKSKMAS